MKNSINGGIYNFGVGYTRQYIRKNNINRDNLVWRVGASTTPQINVNGTQSIVWTNILKNGNYESVTDTL
ncbi:MAG: hypothetical protein IPL12_20885 [Bacteroidetes bacterium]|nr:hypothetical protein [Bacteroidota bacterium]